MAISPKKLGAYMEAQDMDPADLEVELPDELEADEDEGDESEESEALEGFLGMLMEHGTEIESAAHQVELFGGETELDEDTLEQLMASLEPMPQELKDGMVKYFSSLSMDELHELVESLEEMGAIENDAVVVPWLFHASALLAAKA